ncbi:hypothetical protein HDV04_000526 [Boothiomyces sp. JEL0838]|nr:hypothetical protein HDV04_000526 [Boothiomyces sp. JEL0838]
MNTAIPQFNSTQIIEYGSGYEFVNADPFVERSGVKLTDCQRICQITAICNFYNYKKVHRRCGLYSSQTIRFRESDFGSIIGYRSGCSPNEFLSFFDCPIPTSLSYTVPTSTTLQKKEPPIPLLSPAAVAIPNQGLSPSIKTLSDIPPIVRKTSSPPGVPFSQFQQTLIPNTNFPSAAPGETASTAESTIYQSSSYTPTSLATSTQIPDTTSTGDHHNNNLVYIVAAVGLILAISTFAGLMYFKKQSKPKGRQEIDSYSRDNEPTFESGDKTRENFHFYKPALYNSMSRLTGDEQQEKSAIEV